MEAHGRPGYAIELEARTRCCPMGLQRQGIGFWGRDSTFMRTMLYPAFIQPAFKLPTSVLPCLTYLISRTLLCHPRMHDHG